MTTLLKKKIFIHRRSYFQANDFSIRISVYSGLLNGNGILMDI